MKKILIALLLCTFLCVCPVYANDMSSYRYEEGAFSLLLPTDWVLFTPNTADDDPNLSLLGTDGKTLQKKMSENNMVFNSVCPDLSREVTVYWFKNTKSRATFDFNLIKPDALSEQAQSLIDHEFEGGEGVVLPTYLSYEKYHNGQALFLRFEGVIKKGDTNEAEFIQYSTVINEYACNISLHTYGQAITAEDVNLLKKIIDSLTFDEVLKKTALNGVTIPLLGIISLLIFMFIIGIWAIVRYRKRHNISN